MGLVELEEQVEILGRVVNGLRDYCCSSSFGNDWRGNDSQIEEQFKNNTDAYKVLDEMSMNKFIKKYGTVQGYFDSFCSLFSKTCCEEWFLVDLFIGGLPSDIKKGVSMLKPKTLLSARCWAKLQESVLKSEEKKCWSGQESKETEEDNDDGLEVIDGSGAEVIEDTSVMEKASDCMMVLDSSCEENVEDIDGFDGNDELCEEMVLESSGIEEDSGGIIEVPIGLMDCNGIHDDELVHFDGKGNTGQSSGEEIDKFGVMILDVLCEEPVERTEMKSKGSVELDGKNDCLVVADNFVHENEESEILEPGNNCVLRCVKMSEVDGKRLVEEGVEFNKVEDNKWDRDDDGSFTPIREEGKEVNVGCVFEPMNEVTTTDESACVIHFDCLDNEVDIDNEFGQLSHSAIKNDLLFVAPFGAVKTHEKNVLNQQAARRDDFAKRYNVLEGRNKRMGLSNLVCSGEIVDGAKSRERNGINVSSLVNECDVLMNSIKGDRTSNFNNPVDIIKECSVEQKEGRNENNNRVAGDIVLGSQKADALPETAIFSPTGIGVNGHNVIVDEDCRQKSIRLCGICCDWRHFEGSEKGRIGEVEVNLNRLSKNLLWFLLSTDGSADKRIGSTESVFLILSTDGSADKHKELNKAIFSFNEPDYEIWLIFEDKNTFTVDGMIRVARLEDLLAYQLVYSVIFLDQFVYAVTSRDDMLYISWLKGIRKQELLGSGNLNKWNGLKASVVIYWSYGWLDKVTWRLCCELINLNRPQMFNGWNGCCCWGSLELSNIFSRNEVGHETLMKWFTKSRQVIYHHIWENGWKTKSMGCKRERSPDHGGGEVGMGNNGSNKKLWLRSLSRFVGWRSRSRLPMNELAPGEGYKDSARMSWDPGGKRNQEGDA